jgi:hypothetical protein
MVEPRLPRRPLPAVTLSLPSNPNQMDIPIAWREHTARTIKIRHGHLELTNRLRCIKSKLPCPRVRGEALPLDAGNQMIFVSKPGRQTI